MGTEQGKPRWERIREGQNRTGQNTEGHEGNSSGAHKSRYKLEQTFFVEILKRVEFEEKEQSWIEIKDEQAQQDNGIYLKIE